ncbi:MAG: pilus assembly protein [Candidatus Polarisedimenticolaceae bacterium]|nr:pilus assembly protein [Candidatus Polarisedimenticolaceae bacterium]
MLINREKKQQGAVLIMVLLLLMVMTVLGVSGVGNSVLEGKMSGNYLQKNSAEHSAGFGLKVAEQWLRLNVSPANLNVWFGEGVDRKTGLYTSQGATQTEAVCQGVVGCVFDPRVDDNWCIGGPGCPLQKGYVTLDQNDLDTGLLPKDEMSPTGFQPRFIIEYLGLTKKTGTVDETGGLDNYTSSQFSKGELHVFKVTAIGWGYESGIRNVLQRNYYLSLAE